MELDHTRVPVSASVDGVSKRIQLSQRLPDAYKVLGGLYGANGKAAVDAGLDPKVIELVKMRTSQLNGCAYCCDLHSHDTLKLGEDPRRLFVLSAWRETDLFDDVERAALALAEAITRLSETQDVPDAVYEEATSVLTEEQYRAVVWSATLMNTLNRLGVTSHRPLPRTK
ncbi:carboxymuconolactone decarboxylase family protein [Amycolatopsis minnesotensis]|uniref:Carboxymuconolactone decarboxylase family protein n=1 Tax=Amycolatopsis minnesotensis TaxID=337894 RepID=A0ABN2S9A0_9PSEU